MLRGAVLRESRASGALGCWAWAVCAGLAASPLLIGCGAKSVALFEAVPALEPASTRPSGAAAVPGRPPTSPTAVAPVPEPDPSTPATASGRPGASTADAAAEPAPIPAPCKAGPFGAPELVTGLGPARDSRGPAFSPDGETLFFSAVDGDESIWSAHRTGRSSSFDAASLVPGLDAAGSEEGTPFLSWDGLSLYFFSTRPGPGVKGGRDIWIAERPTADARFGEPRVLPSVNTAALEHLPRLSDDELSLLFVSGRASPHAGSNLWMATRSNRSDDFAAPVEVPGINTDAREEGFSLSKDGLILIFASNRAAEPDMDLWVSTRSDPRGEFGEPENLTLLNSSAQDLDPQLSPDGLELFFSSSRNGSFEIFRALRDCSSR